jgi:uncharacterized protein YutE (UPF0331/DUF86 family)
MKESIRDVIWCSCGAHMISVEKEVWGKSHETYVNLWNQKGMNNDGLRSRLRRAWAALRGILYHDGVCLDDEEVENLIKALQDLSM